MPTAMADPTVGGGGDVTYVERAPAMAIGSGITITGGSAYAGEYVEFAVGSAQASEFLSLSTDGAPVTTDGVVSVVGTSVYLGNGASADPIGSIDPVKDGTDGRSLRVNFTSAFANPGFETSDLSGWTAVNQRVNLGADVLAGCPSVDTSTYPAWVSNRDDNVPWSSGVMSTSVQSGQVSEGSRALQLLSSGVTTSVGYDVVHGPAVVSNSFEAAAGDTIYFDWRAFAGADDYHVSGYIVDEGCNQTEVLDATGPANTPWTTKATVIPSSGTYRFVFVSGTFDASGGQAAGASLFIDNVRVFGTNADDDVVQQVARKLMYASTSYNPPASRTVSVTAKSSANGSGSGDVTVTITPIDDAPSLAAVAPTVFTNTIEAQTFVAVTGTLSASDPENDPVTFGISGGVAADSTIDGADYTHHRVGAYGTLYVNSSTGAYAVVPDADAIDARTSDATEEFTVTTTAKSLSGSTPLTVLVDVPDSAPGAPDGLLTQAGDGRVDLTWDPSWWTGGSPTTAYLVESSTDGISWVAAAGAAGPTDTSFSVTGLPNGTPVHLRVFATNATGTSVASPSVSATPYTVPGAPTITSVTPTNRTLSVTFAAPAWDGGSSVLGYQYSVDGGTTWSATTSPVAPGTVVIRPLTNGVTYPVLLRAVNAAGPGAASLQIGASPLLAPIAPPGSTGEPADLAVPVGEARLLVDGVAQPVQVSRTAAGTWRLVGEGFTVDLRGVSADGAALPVDAQGRLVVPDTGSIVVTGSGFRPGSVVDVWLMSSPHLLGQVSVGAAGTFARTLPLPAGIAVGNHTVQLNGVGSDGSVRSVSTGLVVIAHRAAAPAASALPRTGTDASILVVPGLGLLLAGALVLARARRLS